jgi:hypothetical protein
MKDQGETDVILNIKLIKAENEITLTQSYYVEKGWAILSIRHQIFSNTLWLILQKNKRIGRDYQGTPRASLNF